MGVPRDEYEGRLAARKSAFAAAARQDRRVADLRLAAAAVGVALAGAALFTGRFSAWWSALPFACFLALALYHEQVIERRDTAARAVRFYESALGRLTHKWAGTGNPGERFRDPDHPYAEDLDLFGRASLFELLCTARTRGGEATLAGWLKSPAPPEVVRARQAAVMDLRERVDLREDLALLGEELRTAVDAEALISWGSGEPVPLDKGTRVAAAVTSAAAIGALALWPAGYTYAPFVAVVLLQQAWAMRPRARTLPVVRAVEQPARDLALLAALLDRLEREAFTAPLLAGLRADLDTGGIPPSERVSQLRRLVALLDSRRSGLFAPVAMVLLWDVQFAYPIEAWRRQNGALLARWLAVAGELEALAALAGYAYEHPDDPFPEIVDRGPCFEGEDAGHPLLPVEACVRNNLTLGPDLRLLIVSGSNMSGKSTMLRTLGTNTVLALAGAPVRATRLRLSPLAIGASLRVQDSLQGGTSRFYAEITRLRRIVDLTEGDLPLLFLLDEILHGTNSHDRRIGAEAVIRGLVERGAVGLVTTHDLALAEIAGQFGTAAANVHFEDHLEDGKMTFDYRLRTGVVRKSNALELMRAVGLDV